ncbi:MAG: hypothetical protein CR991_11090 [Proteobacteria bacterium]|nr:MAG: hypothetical protein CR991_11090 [Pseudomonadota bacterium]
MKNILSLLLLLLFAHNVHASVGSVNYICQSNRSIEVSYYFNEQGLPTKATAVINGSKRVMPINLSRSNNVDTVFGEEGQYVLAANYIDISNFKSSSILLTSPRNEILFKNCFAAKNKPAAPQKGKTSNMTSGRVHYACQSGKFINVTYLFNVQGLPTKAIAVINGSKRIMPINLSRSNNVDTVFGEEGQYVLGANYIDRNNYRRSSILVTSPKNEILFKNCYAK